MRSAMDDVSLGGCQQKNVQDLVRDLFLHRFFPITGRRIIQERDSREIRERLRVSRGARAVARLHSGVRRVTFNIRHHDER